jgi:hypothetical protein
VAPGTNEEKSFWPRGLRFWPLEENTNDNKE